MMPSLGLRFKDKMKTFLVQGMCWVKMNVEWQRMQEKDASYEEEDSGLQYALAFAKISEVLMQLNGMGQGWEIGCTCVFVWMIA